MCFSPGHGTSPRKLGRLGGGTLEAFTCDRGGRARRTRRRCRRRRRLVRRRLQDPRHGVAERHRRAGRALPGGVGRYGERGLRGRLRHAPRARAPGRDRADDPGDPLPAARHGRAGPVRPRQPSALRGRAHRLRPGPVRRHRLRAREAAGRAARAGVRARRECRSRGVAQRSDRGPGRADHRPDRRADRRGGGDDRAHARVRLGLGAGIDYALLIVGRYREQLASGDSVPHAARVANATAGTSVVAAGAIVVVAIAGLLATGIPFVGKMGIGSAIIIAMVAVGAVTVLPTLMGAFARRLRPKRPEDVEPSQRFARWAGLITRRPLAAAVAGGLVLVLLALPFASLRLGQPDDGNDSSGSTTRVAYDRLAEGFGPGFNGPLVLAATIPAAGSGKTTLTRVQQAVADDPGVAFVSPAQPSPAGDAAVLNVIPKSSPQDERTTELVERLRADVLPGATRGSQVNVYVGGATATLQDLADKIAGRLPVFIALVVGLSVLLLMAVFRSLWVPLASAAFNLLSIASAYGVVVLVFQDGVGSSLLGVDGEVPIVSFVPLFMFAILFGLSMDYNVFLQSRIREEYLGGAGPAQSVVRAMSRVGRFILAAGVRGYTCAPRRPPSSAPPEPRRPPAGPRARSAGTGPRPAPPRGPDTR